MGVVGRAVHRVDVLRHAVGGIEVPGVFHEGRLTPEVAEAPQSPGPVVAVAAFGHKLCAAQVGVTDQPDQLAGRIVGKVQPLGGNGVAAALGGLSDVGDATEGVVKVAVFEIRRAIDLGDQPGAAARRIVNLSEGHHGC